MHEGFFNAEFWVAIGLVIFLAILVYMKVPKAIGDALDHRGKRIREQLAEATQLRQEAETLLKEYEAKRQFAEKEAVEIVARAKADAERFAKESETKLADYVKRRTVAAEAKIAQAEAQATAEIRALVADTAVKTAEQILRGELSVAGTAQSFLTKTLGEVRSKL